MSGNHPWPPPRKSRHQTLVTVLFWAAAIGVMALTAKVVVLLMP